MIRSRRQLLASAGAAVAGLAGCMEIRPDERGDGDRPTLTPRSPEALSGSGRWPQRGGGPGHDGATDARGVPEEGRVHWHLQRVRSGPAVLADGRLFHYAKLGADEDGPPTATRTREPDAGTAHPVYGEPHVVARAARDGTIDWTAPIPEEGTGWAAVGDGRVVVRCSGWIGALDATDGTRVWAHDLGDRPVGEPTVAGDAVVVPLSGISGGGDDDPSVAPRVRVYGLADGAERWTTRPPERGLGVAVGGDTVVVLSHGYDGSGTVLARSLGDGTERWRRAVDGNFFGPPVVRDGTAYVAAGGGRLRALALADGGERWSAPDGGDGVAVGRDGVYTTGGRHLAARDPADGSVRWRFDVEGESLAIPAVGAGTVYVGGNYVDLHALDAGDGSERWSASFPTQTVEGDMVMSGLRTQPVVADGALYAFAVDGLYAFGPAD